MFVQEHYQPDLEDMEELSEMREELMNRIHNIMNKSMEYRNSFDNYAYLWVSVSCEISCLVWKYALVVS